MKKKYLTYNGRIISNLLFSNTLLLIICIIPFFKTSYFDSIPYLSQIANGLLVIEFCIFSVIAILQKYITRFGMIIYLLQIWIFFIAPRISGSQPPSYYYFYQSLAAICFFEIGFNVNPKKIIDITAKVFTVFICANAFTQLIPSLQYISNEGIVLLFGLRTGISLFVIPGISINLLRDILSEKKNICTVVTFSVGAFSLLYDRVATGLIELALIIILLIVLRKRKEFHFGFIAVGIIIFDLLLTIMGKSFAIINVISAWFNKDITLSGRTEIWAKVILKLMKSPIAGFGADSTVPIGFTFRPAHNQWLHFAMEGGYVALIIMLVGVIITILYLNKQRSAKWYTIYSVSLIAVLTGSITEIQTYIPFFYVILDLPFLLNFYNLDRK